MTLLQAEEGKEYIIRQIETDGDQMTNNAMESTAATLWIQQHAVHA